MTDAQGEHSRQRRLALEGAVNFRDMGGYATADGRETAWGRLYRSDALAKLTPADLERVAALGLRNIFDLRHEIERAERPSRFPTAGGKTPPRVHSIGFLPYGAERVMAHAAAGDLDRAGAQAALMALYRRFPLEQQGVYRRILQELGADGALPALIHCTSGKDRTGFTMAILLRALGVPRATVIEDYLITDRYRHDLSHMLHPRLSPSTVNTILRAHPDYLRAAFATIDEHWGSDQAYLRQGIGLTENEQQSLGEQLLYDSAPRTGQ